MGPKSSGDVPTGGKCGAQVARRTGVSVTGAAVYSPQFRLGVFNDPLSLTGSQDPFTSVLPDLTSTVWRLCVDSHRYVDPIDWPPSIPGHSYSLNNVDYIDDAFNYRSQFAGLRYSQRLTRHMTRVLGTDPAAECGQRVGFLPQDIHHLDAGVDYGRALSISRRTRVSFSTGSAILSGSGETFGGQTSGFHTT